ncbi:MAG: VanZ family protein [Aeromicrobium sp.]|uniref:VanZ family protein n=1 Tax=Aeromicrobium sp. TaxID=1871063 RepID=UPI003C326D43
MLPRRSVIGTGALYLISLSLIGLWPTHVDRSLDLAHRPPTTWLASMFDLTPTAAYSVGETAANALLFMPLGIFLVVLLPRQGWLCATALAASLSVLIELAQALARPERTGSLGDVVANTIGAGIAAGLVVAWRWRTAETVVSRR